MDAFRSILFKYYKNERLRAEKCLSDIIDLMNSGSDPAEVLEEIEGRLIQHYSQP